MQASNLILLSGQVALARSMDVIANNVANAGTTGFKREGIAFDTYMTRAMSGKTTSFVYDRATYRDVASGPIMPTNNPLDLAIQGKGYFQVQMPDGSTGYTRAGAFRLNTDGQIVTMDGKPLLGDGSTITVPNTVSEINISGDGYITARIDNGTSLAQLGKITLADFANEQLMEPVGNGVYKTAQPSQPPTNSGIAQGSLEKSNVEPVVEITSMIQIARRYEQIANLVTMESQRSTEAVQRLTKPASA